MCGIVGYSGAFSEAALRSALNAIAHRGPDDAGVYVDQPAGIGLGHARLSIIDLSPLGHQPMVSDEGSVALVFNGEIYNYQELQSELSNGGHVFHGRSDTEVLLQMYLAEGEAMLSRLNGIFSFAIWDSRSQSLFLARDGLGVKPLYFAESPTGVAFASELKGLVDFVPESKTLDPLAIHSYLTFLWCPGEGTPLKGIRKLGPGEAMQIRNGKIERKWIWYRLPQFRGVAADLGETSAVKGTIDGLKQAVERQMVADVPVGAFLSGGLDSSAIVALAREHNPDIRCFTIDAEGGQDEGTAEDLPYAKRVAEHLGVPLDVVQINAVQMANDLERMVVQLDEPLADPAPLNVLYISQLAREHGIKVLLSGAGGDDLFTGYRRHRAVQLEKYWKWMPLELRNGLANISNGLDKRNAWSRRLGKLVNGAGLSGDESLVNYFAWAREADLNELYSESFRNSLEHTHANSEMLEFLKPLPEAMQPLDRMLALEQRYFLTDHNLNYTDKMSMAAGVEVRVPFLDQDLVEFAQWIPLRYKQRGAVGKWVLKKAMEPYLPHDVIYRPKSGFAAPLRRWMRHELRELLGDILSEESLKRRGLFNPQAVQRLIAKNDSGEVDAAYTLLSLLCIEIWCRAYLK